MNINAIKTKNNVLLKSSISWWEKSIGPIHRSGLYLLGGDAGAGKSTLFCQIALDIAKNYKVLYVATEQSPFEVNELFKRLHSAPLPLNNIEIIVISSLKELPDLYIREILSPHGKHNRCDLIIIDSLQGGRLSSQKDDNYKGLEEFFQKIRLTGGPACFMVCQLNKQNRLAGPKSLEFLVDTCIDLRKIMNFCLLTVPKNRFKKSPLKPHALRLTEVGHIEDPHALPDDASIAWGFSKRREQILEVQCNFNIPQSRQLNPEIHAHNLPKGKIKLLKKIFEMTCGKLSIDSTGYDVSLYIPGIEGNPYQNELDASIYGSMMASIHKIKIPANILIIGEIDLRQKIRQPDDDYLLKLAWFLITKEHPIKNIVLSTECASLFKSMRPCEEEDSIGERFSVIGVSTIDELLEYILKSAHK